MEFREWEPYYREILHEFGYRRQADEAVARLLANRLPPDRADPKVLRRLLEDRVVTVLGNGPNLLEELPLAEGVLVAADEAVGVARQHGVAPDLLVSDLDGDEDALLAANRAGTLAVVHAHGDNETAVRRLAPRFTSRSLGTTQAEPIPGVWNFGGFTDGDRAVFLAEHFRAREIRLLGFDYDHPHPKDHPAAVKRRKLAWARRLIEMLAERTSIVYPSLSN